MKFLKAFFAVLLLAAGHASAIDYGLMKNEFGFDAGGVEGVGGNDFQDVLSGAFVGGFHYTHFLMPRLGLGVQFDYIKPKDLRSSMFLNSSVAGFYFDDNVQVQNKYSDLSLMGTARFNIIPRGLAIPYLVTGLGLNRFTVEGQSEETVYTNIPGLPAYSAFQTSTKASKVGLSGMIGAGVDLMLSEVCRLGIEGRYNLYKQKTIAGADDLVMTMVKGRLSWYFGAN